MKNSTFKAVVLFGCVVITVVSAFATKRFNQSISTQIGHKSVGLKCIPTEVTCTELPTGVVCRDNEDKALYLHIGPISCANQLWKPTP